MLASFKNILTQPAVFVSLLVGVLMVGVERLGVLEPIEMKAFDLMMQRRGNLDPDERILVVGFTENDIQKLKQGSPSGEILDTVLSKLESYQAKVIGLDFFRDVPVGSDSGHQKLLTRLKQSERIVPICLLGADKIPAVPPPAGIEPEIAGFADLVEDKDGVIRRNLLLVPRNSKSACATQASLGMQVALQYLNIQPQFTPQGMQLGKTLFKRLEANSGGYQNIDAQGFQILVNYRSEHNVAQQVTITDVLSDRFNPKWVKNRVVLIGATAQSSLDIRDTPYSDGRQDNVAGKMPGVVIHAQMVSQILDAVSGKRPLFWFWPEWGEILWIWGWTLAGGVLGARIQHPLRLGFFGSVTIATLLLSGFVIFLNGGWVPLAPPTLGFLLAGSGVVAYTAFYNKLLKDKISLQIQEQKDTISLLQALLRNGGNNSTQVPMGMCALPQEKILNKRYKVSQLLGCGGFSYTYLAEDTYRPGKPLCVVKHLQPARNDEVFLEVARRLFRTEAEILELLGHHEQITELMAYFEENQQFYLIQEYIKGHSLQVELTPGKRFSETQVVDLLQDILPVLMFVHSHGVIHRDIKPSNLMRREKDQRIVLIDFGAVKLIQPQQLQEDNPSEAFSQENLTVAVGTVGYAPPEQFIGQPRLNSDIYALGMIAIQALTGTPAKNLERDLTTGTLLWRHLAETTEELAAVIDKMVSYDFWKRYQSVEEVLQMMKNL